MKLKKWFIVGVMVALAGLASAAPTYWGTLQYVDGELDATGNWATSITTMDWSVTLTSLNGSAYWEYKYILTIPSTGAGSSVSHLILEVSEDPVFDLSEIVNENHTPTSGDPKLYSATLQGNSNPDMDRTIWGVSFDGSSTDADTSKLYFQYELSFLCKRNPELGYFYAKGG